MERVHKWLTVLQVVAKLLAAALAAVAADTAVGEPLRGAVHRAAAVLSVAAAAEREPSESSLNLLVPLPSAKATLSA